MWMQKGALFSIVALAFCLLGMGGERAQAVHAPRTDRNFNVQIIDQSGLRITASSFTADGLTFLPGKLGLSETSIDFAKIVTVSLSPADDGVDALVSLHSGAQQRMLINPMLTFYGISEWGDFRIEARDIRSLVFTQPN